VGLGEAELTDETSPSRKEREASTREEVAVVRNTRRHTNHFINQSLPPLPQEEEHDPTKKRKPHQTPYRSIKEHQLTHLDAMLIYFSSQQ
jgi:hypothetical protein